METVINYFETIPSSYRAGILIGGLVFFWILEGIIPLFPRNYNQIKHAWINIFFTITTIIINFAFASLILMSSDWVVANKFGLLYIIEMPTWVFMIIGMLVLDLVGAYFIHWLEHKTRWMWRFHLIHHTDTHVDTTTANRHHPGESVFRAIFTTIAVLITGAPIWLVMLYQSLSALLSQFNHANITLPKWLDDSLSWIIVSPNMHKVHHHYTLPLTDTNYGNIFSIWDRIFGTFAYIENPKSLVYGIDTHFKPEENEEMGNLLKIPFQTYRPPTGAKFVEKEKA
ncbi:MAG: sterol desaturase family protein [Thermoflexibacter sp.]|jgi:sterol desaturase/sphingolipid hydroxylase (fatty acid hydroxylase superfamily)|nr:sterol desaturase family protein [Thermoflexibacter sp.]